MSLGSIYKHFGDCRKSEVKTQNELEQDYFKCFGETEEYITDKLIEFAVYTIAECNSRATEECGGNCYNCIFNMLRNYNKTLEDNNEIL